ncbi:MAG TPA: hypothetical protein VL426_01780 [Candidatus Binatia bacterium]|nr:hypothetical protein [Candidatus Binatia bacterium]
MITKTKKDVAIEFLNGLGATRGEEFRALLMREIGPDLIEAIVEYSESIAKRWSPGLAPEATTLIVIGYLLRAHEDQWKAGTKPFFPA